MNSLAKVSSSIPTFHSQHIFHEHPRHGHACRASHGKDDEPPRPDQPEPGGGLPGDAGRGFGAQVLHLILRVGQERGDVGRHDDKERFGEFGLDINV